MRYLKSILIITLFMFCTVQCGVCVGSKSKLDKLIEQNPLSKTATIAVSVKDVSNGKVIYNRDESKLLNPASAQKLFTTMAALDTVGADYEFKTQLYKDKANNLYIKLGADPLFTSADLKNMIKSLPVKKFNAVFIDDSIIDDIGWGVGWMSDDDTNPLMPRFSPYNIDRNILKIKITPLGAQGSQVTKITFDPAASFSVINITKYGKKDDVKVVKHSLQAPDIIYLEGNVSGPMVVMVPVNSPKRYFSWKFNEFLNLYNVKRINGFSTRVVPPDAILLTEVKHPVNAVAKVILKNSDNLSSESLFKVAGGKYAKTKGTAVYSEAMFLEYCVKNGLPTDNLIIVDASGVSRNNLFTADWMTNALVKLYQTGKFEYLAQTLATPYDGTMRGRLPDLLGDLWAKTGTHSNISTITGYVNGKSNSKYAFTIMIQHYIGEKPIASKLEDAIIAEINNLN